MTSDQFKISGKTLAVPKVESNSKDAEWKISFRPGGWLIATSSQGERRRLMIHDVRNQLSVSLNGYLWAGQWIPGHREQSHSAAPSDSDLIAQFPGRVRKVLVETGTLVKEGDSLVLVEAMKMEFAIRAPFGGRVKQVCAQEGQQISPGDRFILLEMITEGIE